MSPRRGARPSPPPATLLVVRLYLCEDDSCASAGTRHLLVRYDNVQVVAGQAAAISYTWGEFNRQTRRLGHDSAGRDVAMNLGEEWAIAEVIETLAQLSTEFGACWIDQLCMRQDDTNIKQIIQMIPEIYRTFQVVALMPVPPCSCLEPAAKDLMVSFQQFATGEKTSHESLGCHHDRLYQLFWYQFVV